MNNRLKYALILATISAILALIFALLTWPFVAAWLEIQNAAGGAQ